MGVNRDGLLARIDPATNTVTKTIDVPLQSDGDTCTVRFTVSRTAVPEVVTGGLNPDPRRLGMHFTFRYRP